MFMFVESSIRLNEQHSQTSYASTIVILIHKTQNYGHLDLIPIRFCEPIHINKTMVDANQLIQTYIKNDKQWSKKPGFSFHPSFN